MPVARPILDEWLERVDQRLLDAWYQATSVRVDRMRDALRGRRAPFVDPHRARSASPHALVDIDRTAHAILDAATTSAGRRSALAGLVGAASLAPEVVAATIGSMRLAQRLCVVYGFDPGTDRGHMALHQALAAAYDVELPPTGPADLRVTDLAALVHESAPPSASARLTRAMARATAGWALHTRRRWLPLLGSRPQAALARRRTLRAGTRMIEVLRRLSEVPGSTRDHVEEAVELVRVNAAVVDLLHVVDLATERGGHLLTAGEQRVAHRIRSLEGEAAVAYARLTARVPTEFEVVRLTITDVDDVPGALECLRQAELVDGLVRWRDRAGAMLKGDLVAALRRLGRPARGRRELLVEQLRDARDFTSSRFVRVRHRGLVRRFERWAFLEPFPDRSKLVMERIGVASWPDYALTTGAVLPSSRAAWLAYESLADRLGGLGPPLTPREALSALSDGTARGAGRLDLRRALRRELMAVAYRWERDKHHAEAIEIYESLVREGGAPLPRVAFRWAQALVAEGQATDAFELLSKARPQAAGVERVTIARAMRRIGRTVGRGVAPDPPLRRAPMREIRLERHDKRDEPRPRWGSEEQTVEAAVCRWLREHGRIARHGEGRPFSTLFALLFSDILFLPVPGALPVRRLSRPLDFGTPDFRRRRASAIEQRWLELGKGGAVDRIREGWTRLHGTRLVGARWNHVARRDLEVLAEHLGPVGLRTILEPMLDHGTRHHAGLPDLVVWPGQPVRLPGAFPSRLQKGLLLAEIKGPGDRLRDAQRLWLDRLIEAGIRTELWEVAPPPRP